MGRLSCESDAGAETRKINTCRLGKERREIIVWTKGGEKQRLRGLPAPGECEGLR